MDNNEIYRYDEHTIVGALDYTNATIEQEHNDKLTFMPDEDASPNLTNLLQKYENLKIDNEFLAKYMMAKTSHEVQSINQWVLDNGFTIQLQDCGTGPLMYYTACMLKMLMKFKNGDRKKSSLVSQEKTYKSFLLNPTDYFTIKNTEQDIIISIPTEDPDINVNISPLSTEIKYLISNYSDYIKNMTVKPFERINPRYIEVPNVDYHVEPDISWLKQLGFSGQKAGYRIQQALQEIIFKMDYKGVDLKACTMLGYSGCSGMPAEWDDPIILNEPFLLWMTHSKCYEPVFIAHLDQRFWEEENQ